MIMGSIGIVELGLLAVVAIGACLLTHFVTKRWLWAVGFVACFIVATINTPSDVVSTLIVGTQCCGLYVVSAWAWRAIEARPMTTER